MSKRSEVENFIITNVEAILPGGGNRENYEKLFKSMDDEAFDSWMKRLAQGEIKLCIIAPNQSDKKITVENNFNVAKSLGHNFFERIVMDGKGGSSPYLSKPSYPVFDLPVRRQAQIQIKKISIPDNNNSVDVLSGQAVGASKGSKISYPELQVMSSLSLDETIAEFIKYRGGDAQGFTAMNDSIARTGRVRLGAIEPLSSGVTSTKTLGTLLTSIHLKNTLPK